MRLAREHGLGIAVRANLRRTRLHARTRRRAQRFQMRRFLRVRLGRDGDGPARKAILPIRPAVFRVLHANEDAVLIGVFLRAKGGGGIGRRRRCKNTCRGRLRLCPNIGAVVGFKEQTARRTELVALRKVHRHTARLTREGGDAVAGKLDAARCRLCNGLQGRRVSRFPRTCHSECKIPVCCQFAALGTKGLHIVMHCVADEDVPRAARRGGNADDFHLACALITRLARDRVRLHLRAGENEIVPTAHVQLTVGGIDSGPSGRALIDLQPRSAVFGRVERNRVRTKRTACRNDLCVRPVPHNAGRARYCHAADACLHGVLTDMLGALCADIEFASERFPADAVGCRNEDA